MSSRSSSHHQAFHDPLTDLANRSLFINRVKDALAADTAEVAVLFIDLDDFKTFNDSLGHSAGDELLMAVAERLRQCVRPSDVIARLGGDEFAVMVQDTGAARQNAVAVAVPGPRRVRRAGRGSGPARSRCTSASASRPPTAPARPTA